MLIFNLWDPSIDEKGGVVLTPTKKPMRVAHTVVNDGQVVKITRRLAFGQSGKGADDLVLAVKLKEREILIKSLDDQSYSLLSPTGGRQAEVSHQTKRFKLEDGQGSWGVHFGVGDTLHRVMNFELHKGNA